MFGSFRLRRLLPLGNTGTGDAAWWLRLPGLPGLWRRHGGYYGGGPYYGGGVGVVAFDGGWRGHRGGVAAAGNHWASGDGFRCAFNPSYVRMQFVL